MNKLRNIADFADENAIGTVRRRYTRMAQAIQVLSVGPVDRGSMVHDALLKGRNFHLTIAADYLELWGMPTQDSIQVAIVHTTLSEFETEAACRLIRRRWPHARILVVLRGECCLNSALYDDRVTPNAFPEVLLATIGRLTGMWNERRFGVA